MFLLRNHQQSRPAEALQYFRPMKLIILLAVGTFLLIGYFFNPQGVCTTVNTVVKDAITQWSVFFPEQPAHPVQSLTDAQAADFIKTSEQLKSREKGR